MTPLDTSALADLAGKKPRAANAKKAAWEPIDLTRVKTGRYFACDQSLKASGLVVVFFNAETGMAVVEDAATLNSGQDQHESWEEVLTGTDSLQERFAAWGQDDLLRGADHVVHEAPPTGRGQFLHPELSLATAYAFRRALIGRFGREWFTTRLRRMEAPIGHKTLVTGNSKATKAQVRAALGAHYGAHVGHYDRLSNEHTRDAFCIALTCAARLGT